MGISVIIRDSTGSASANVNADGSLTVVQQFGRDFGHDVSAGVVPNHSAVNKFGYNPAVGTTEEDVWGGGGSYNWLTAADTIRVAAGGNAADDAGGAGARSLLAVGLGEDWRLQETVLSLNGTSAGASSALKFIRLFRAYVTEAGAYTGNNTGDITIETTGGTSVGFIRAGYGQSELGLYSVPHDQTLLIERVRYSIVGSKPLSVRMWQRQSADRTGAPFSAKRIIREFPEVDGTDGVAFDPPVPIPSRSDVWFSAQAPSGGSTSAVGVSFDAVLEDREA